MAEANLDCIHIRDLLLRCIVGINADERKNKQDVLINITLTADLSRACRSDNIEDTVNYRTIKKDIIRMVETSDFFLLERLAEEISDICLQDQKVRQVVVNIQKPGALRFARSVDVEITRQREPAR